MTKFGTITDVCGEVVFRQAITNDPITRPEIHLDHPTVLEVNPFFVDLLALLEPDISPAEITGNALDLVPSLHRVVPSYDHETVVAAEGVFGFFRGERGHVERLIPGIEEVYAGELLELAGVGVEGVLTTIEDPLDMPYSISVVEEGDRMDWHRDGNQRSSAFAIDSLGEKRATAVASQDFDPGSVLQVEELLEHPGTIFITAPFGCGSFFDLTRNIHGATLTQAGVQQPRITIDINYRKVGQPASSVNRLDGSGAYAIVD